MHESRIPKELHRKVFELTLALYRVTDFFPQGEVLRKNLREKANDVFGCVAEYGYATSSEVEAMSILSKIESLNGFLGIAQTMRFVRPINCTVLEREYEYLAAFFMRELEGMRRSTAGDTKKEEQEAPYVFDEKRADNTPLAKEELSTWEEFAAAPHEESFAHKEENPVITVTTSVAGTEESKWLSPITGDLNERQKKILAQLQENHQAKISDFYSFFTDISSKTIQRDLQDLVMKNVLKKHGEKRWTVYSLNNVQ